MFTGNMESSRVKYNPLPELKWARYIRVVIETKVGTGCIRFELYGCTKKEGKWIIFNIMIVSN